MVGTRKKAGKNRNAAAPEWVWATGAAAVVLLLACIHLANRGASGQGGPASYGPEIESALAHKDCEEAARTCRSYLHRHPLERRLHYYYGRCMLERGFPGVALSHLLAAAAEVPREAHAQYLPPASPDEIAAVLHRLEARFPEYAAQPWAQLCTARLAAAQADWAGWEAAVRKAASLLDAEEPGREEGNDWLPLAAAAFGGDEARWQALGLSPEEVRALLGAVGTVFTDREAMGIGGSEGLSRLAVLSGGLLAGGRDLLMAGDECEALPASAGWLFAQVDLASGALEAQQRFSLTGIAEEEEAFRQWVAAHREGSALIICAGGEATNRLSANGRRMLHEELGLAPSFEEDAMVAYACALVKHGAGASRVEAVAPALGIPAMVVIE